MVISECGAEVNNEMETANNNGEKNWSLLFLALCVGAWVDNGWTMGRRKQGSSWRLHRKRIESDYKEGGKIIGITALPR